MAAFVSLWAAFMLQVFKRHTARVRQIWGVTSDEEPIVQINPDWDYESKRENCGFFVNICTVLYIFLYVGAIFGVLAWQFQLDESDPLYSYSSLILVAVTMHLQSSFFHFIIHHPLFSCMHWAVSDAPSGVKIKSLYRL